MKHISKVMGVVFIFTRRSEMCFDVYVFWWFLRIFWCRLLNLCVMSISYVLLMDGAVILFYFHTWCIFFSTNVIRLDVEPIGYWRLYFWHVSFSMGVRQSDIETSGSWLFDFGPPGSLLISVLVSPSLWSIHPCGGTKLILGLTLWRYSCLVDVWWLGGWCLVK